MKSLISSSSFYGNVIFATFMFSLILSCGGSTPDPVPICDKAHECVNISRVKNKSICGVDQTGDKIIKLYDIDNDHPDKTVSAWVNYRIDYLDDPALPSIEGVKGPIHLKAGENSSLGCEFTFDAEGLEKHRFWVNRACFSDDQGICTGPETGPGDSLPPPEKPRVGSCQEECSNKGELCIVYELDRKNPFEKNIVKYLYNVSRQLLNKPVPFSVDISDLVNIAPGANIDYGPMYISENEGKIIADATGDSSKISLPVSHPDIAAIFVYYPSNIEADFHRKNGVSADLKFNEKAKSIRIDIKLKDTNNTVIKDSIILISITEGVIQFITAKSYCIKITGWRG